jgi:hypothetical protein
MATVQVPEADYRDLRETVAGLEQRVTILEHHIDADSGRIANFPDLTGSQDEIVQVTKDLFPGDVTIKASVDPEFPHEPFPVVHASAYGDIKEIEDRRIEWHIRVRKLSPDLANLPLRITIRK